MRKIFYQAALVSLLMVTLLNSETLSQEVSERVKPKRHRSDAQMPGAEIWAATKLSTGQNAMPTAGAKQDWIEILNENFESGFPQTNKWTLSWSSAAPYSWDDVNFNPHQGSRSAWCAGGRQSTQVPILNPASDNYPNDLDAWMIWGPFDLTDAIDAELQFWYWNDSEEGFDFFSVGGSLDDNDYFFPVEVSGNSNGWQLVNYNLKSLSGQPQVWIAFNFFSDDQVNAKGAFVDDIVLRKMTANTGPTITHTPVTSGLSGTALPIAATILDNDAITAKLFYRSGGSSTYKNVAMAANANTFTGVIPAAEVTSRGLEYYISASDGQSTTYDPPSNFETNPHRIRVTVANWTNPSPQPGGSAQNAYRLISIPSELRQSRTDSVLFDDLGAYNDAQWRIFRFEGGNYFELPDPKAAAFAPGKAFWLIVREANKTIDAGSGLSTTTVDSFTITLEPGWNDIGLPFDFPVNWSQVRVDRAGVDGPYLYEGTWLLPSNVSQLVSWKGYAVKNLRTVPLTLKIPPQAADASSPAMATLGKKSDHDWAIQIKAQCEEARDEMNFLGWSSAATPEKDASDFSEPPPIGEFVSLYFPHEEWRHYPGNYTNDYRPPAEDGEIWRMVIETNILTKPLQISWSGLEKLPSYLEASLVDHYAGVRLDLKKQERYIFQSAKSRELFLVVGGKAFVENQAQHLITPTAYTLWQNYPNPFLSGAKSPALRGGNPETMIRYQLAVISDQSLERHVTLAIYNTVGQEVRVLVNRKQEPGSYEVIWDGKDDAGQLMPSGLYFYRLVAGEFQQTRKMTLLR